MQDITSQEAAAKHKVLQTIGLIPYGKVCTYGVIAEYAGLPRRARYVGTVLKNLPAIQKSHGIELSTVREKVRSLQGQKNIDYSLRN